MGLIDRITALWRRNRQAGGEEEPRQTTAAEVMPPAQPLAGMGRFRADRDRRQMILDCREMYDEDTRAEGALSALARDATKRGFRVKVTSGADVMAVQQVTDDLIRRLHLFRHLDDWVRLTLRDGDSLLEVSVDEQGLIQRLTRKPTLQMHRNSDEADQFEDPTRAYWWADEIWIGQEPPRDATWFADWQIIHARWHHDEGARYGKPVFGSARSAWKRIKEGEFDIAVRRKTRSGMKYVHTLEGGTPADIAAYREQNKDVLSNPFAAVADFFTNKPGGIQVVQGDARLAEIGDVQHHIRTWWIASPVPMSLLGYGQDLNRDVLEQQKEQYDDSIESMQGWIEEQIVVPLLELQWLLLGIWPRGLEYEIIWTGKRAITPADIRDVADAVSRLQLTGLLTDEALVMVLAQVLPGMDVEEMLAHVREQNDEIDRIAQAAAQRLGRGDQAG